MLVVKASASSPSTLCKPKATTYCYEVRPSGERVVWSLTMPPNPDPTCFTRNAHVETPGPRSLMLRCLDFCASFLALATYVLLLDDRSPSRLQSLVGKLWIAHFSQDIIGKRAFFTILFKKCFGRQIGISLAGRLQAGTHLAQFGHRTFDSR